MSTIPGTNPYDHAFIRPGQIRPEHPVADACMVCGRTEAAHDDPFHGIPNAHDEDNQPLAPRGTHSSDFDEYNALVAAEAERLTATIADIRTAQDAGHLTTCEAADNRIAVLEEHLRRLGELRDRYLGD